MADEPRPAASVIVARGGASALEVLLAQRTPRARFMGGAWVFPGGALDPGEEDRAAAVREVAEEVGLALPDPAALVRFSRWITPRGLPVRFDTHFFLAAAPPGQEPRPDGSEIVACRWMAPAAALAAPDLTLMFPTVRHLEQLLPFASADELLAWADDGREIVAVEPSLE